MRKRNNSTATDLLDLAIVRLVQAKLQINRFRDQTRIDQARQALAFSDGRIEDTIASIQRALAIERNELSDSARDVPFVIRISRKGAKAQR